MQKKLNASFGFDDDDGRGAHAAAPRAAKVRRLSAKSQLGSVLDAIRKDVVGSPS